MVESSGILEAGPAILVSTRGTDGRTNLMTAGFHMMMQHAPPLVGVIFGPWDYSYQAWQDPLLMHVIHPENSSTEQYKKQDELLAYYFSKYYK